MTTRSDASVDGVRHELLTEAGDDDVGGQKREVGEVTGQGWIQAFGCPW